MLTGSLAGFAGGLGGQDGVRHVLRSLRRDCGLTMRLAGFAGLAGLGP